MKQVADIVVEAPVSDEWGWLPGDVLQETPIGLTMLRRALPAARLRLERPLREGVSVPLREDDDFDAPFILPPVRRRPFFEWPGGTWPEMSASLTSFAGVPVMRPVEVRVPLLKLHAYAVVTCIDGRMWLLKDGLHTFLSAVAVTRDEKSAWLNLLVRAGEEASQALRALAKEIIAGGHNGEHR